MQRVVMAALETAQHLKRTEGHGRGLVGADQRPEIFLAVFKTLERRLAIFTRAPLQVIEHPPPVITDLHARIDEATMALGQAFTLGALCSHQGELLLGLDLKLDQLSEAAIFL